MLKPKNIQKNIQKKYRGSGIGLRSTSNIWIQIIWQQAVKLTVRVAGYHLCFIYALCSIQLPCMLPVISLIAVKRIIKKQQSRGSRSIPYHIYWRWTWVPVRRHETYLLHLISLYVASAINSSLSNENAGTISKSQRRPHAAISWSSGSTCRRSDVITSWIRTGLSCALPFHKITRCQT